MCAGIVSAKWNMFFLICVVEAAPSALEAAGAMAVGAGAGGLIVAKY